MNSSVKIVLALSMTIGFWASAFVGIRFSLGAYHPGSLALLRFLIASLCMILLYSYSSDYKRPDLRDAIEMALLGVAGIGVYNLALNVGELTVSAGIASFIIGLIPLLTIILSYFFLSERVNAKVCLGVLISVVGMVIISVGEHDGVSFNLGTCYVFIATLMGAAYTVIQKKYLRRYPPIVVTAYVIWGGTVMLSIFTLELSHDIIYAPWSATLAVVYMGIFPAAIAYLCWSYVLSHMSASRASIYLYVLPFVSTVMGAIFLQEYPSALSMTGGIIALIGAAVAVRFRAK